MDLTKLKTVTILGDKVFPSQTFKCQQNIGKCTFLIFLIPLQITLMEKRDSRFQAAKLLSIVDTLTCTNRQQLLLLHKEQN